jgi:GNAT superfamily N-acetyltransferase
MDAIETMLFEDPFYLYLALGLGVVLLGGVWFHRRETKWLLWALLLVCMGAGLYAVERAVVTDRERIRLALDDIARCVQAGDLDGASVYLDEKFTGWGVGALRMGRAATVLAIKGYRSAYGIARVRYVGDRPVTLTGKDRAEGVVQTMVFYGTGDPPGRVLLAWKLEWVKRPEGWRIRQAERTEGPPLP